MFLIWLLIDRIFVISTECSSTVILKKFYIRFHPPFLSWSCFVIFKKYRASKQQLSFMNVELQLLEIILRYVYHHKFARQVLSRWLSVLTGRDIHFVYSLVTSTMLLLNPVFLNIYETLETKIILNTLTLTFPTFSSPQQLWVACTTEEFLFWHPTC